jgi:hypothetical protein
VNASAIAIGAGQGVGVGLGIIGAFRFFRWLIEFTAKRLDNRTDRLEQREQALEERFNSRLRNVEQELDRYREATMLLVNALAEKDPQNQALRDVGRILRSAIPKESGDIDRDLMDRLDKIPGTRDVD